MKLRLTTFLFILFASSYIFAQTTNMQQVELIDAEDNQVAPFNNKSEYTLVLLSSIFCGKCINELSTYSKLYPKWKEEYNLTIFAVNTDAYPTYEGKVKRKIKRTDYAFATYLDYKNELSALLKKNKDFDNNIGMIERYGKMRLIPLQAILFDKNGNILKHTKGFKSGYEDEMEKVLKKNSEGNK